MELFKSYLVHLCNSHPKVKYFKKGKIINKVVSDVMRSVTEE